MISWWLDAAIPSPSLRGEAFRGNPNVPPTPSMDLDAFLMWGSKLILFAKKICACVTMVTGWICRSNGCDCKMLSCQRQWLFMADRGHGACTMNINHSIMSSKHLQHMKSQLTREDHWSKMIQDWSSSYWSSPLLLFQTLWLATKLIEARRLPARSAIFATLWMKVDRCGWRSNLLWFPDLVFMKPWKTHGVKKCWESFSVKMFLSPYQPVVTQT